jgi:hypothetical protein
MNTKKTTSMGLTRFEREITANGTPQTYPLACRSDIEIGCIF